MKTMLGLMASAACAAVALAEASALTSAAATTLYLFVIFIIGFLRRFKGWREAITRHWASRHLHLQSIACLPKHATRAEATVPRRR